MILRDMRHDPCLVESPDSRSLSDDANMQHGLTIMDVQVVDNGRRSALKVPQGRAAP
jgi:hypothetical protein